MEVYKVLHYMGAHKFLGAYRRLLHGVVYLVHGGAKSPPPFHLCFLGNIIKVPFFTQRFLPTFWIKKNRPYCEHTAQKVCYGKWGEVGMNVISVGGRSVYTPTNLLPR